MCKGAVMICSKCKKEFDDDMNFCPYCGIKVSDMEQYEPETKDMPKEDSPETEEKGRNLEADSDCDTTTNEEPEKAIEVAPETDLEAALAAAKAAGEKNEEETSDEDEQDEDLPKNKTTKVILITIIIGIFVIVAIVLAMYYSEKGGLGKNTSTKGTVEQSDDVVLNDATAAVELYLQGYQDKDVNKIIASYPDFMSETILKNMTEAEVWSQIEQTFVETIGEDWTAEYEILKTAEISEEDLSSLSSDLSQGYNAQVTFTEGFWVRADMNVTGSVSSSKMQLLFAVVKYNDDWKIAYYAPVTENGNGSSNTTDNSATE